MKKITILLLTILSFYSCQSSEERKIVEIDNKYSVSIPSFLTKVIDLNEDASLQYQHAWKEFYVIIIDESKSELQKTLTENNLTDTYSNDVTGYSELLLNGFEEELSVSKKSKVLDTLVNNMPARLLTITGKVEGIDVFYSLAYIQGKERYYQIMSWTLLNKEYEYKDKMNQIIYSLKELKNN